MEQRGAKMADESFPKLVRCKLCRHIVEASWYEGTPRDAVPPGCPNDTCSGLVGDTEELPAGVCEHGIWRIKCDTCCVEDAYGHVTKLKKEIETLKAERAILNKGEIPYLAEDGTVKSIGKRHCECCRAKPGHNYDRRD